MKPASMIFYDDRLEDALRTDNNQRPVAQAAMTLHYPNVMLCMSNQCQLYRYQRTKIWAIQVLFPIAVDAQFGAAGMAIRQVTRRWGKGFALLL